jgi:peptidoglycan/xylan/chitin deacetylase (PgdA/CDA1 family)
VAITFDDGYENYATNALPVLRRHAAPSVVYLSSSLVGPDPKSPFEFRLAHALESQLGSTVSIDRLGFETRIDTTADLVDAYDTIHLETKYRRVEFRNAVLSGIGGDEREPVPMLSAADIRSLTGDPLVTCGSHGADHVPYKMLSDDEQRDAVEASRTRFARLLGSPPEHFSFPYGSYDAVTIEVLKNAGVISGVTTRPRSLSPRDWDRPYTMPRIDGATASLRGS